jgi:hypothetical protein
MNRLSLADASWSGRLEEFVSKEEMRGVGPIARADFAANVASGRGSRPTGPPAKAQTPPGARVR